MAPHGIINIMDQFGIFVFWPEIKLRLTFVVTKFPQKVRAKRDYKPVSYERIYIEGEID